MGKELLGNGVAELRILRIMSLNFGESIKLIRVECMRYRLCSFSFYSYCVAVACCS